MFELENEGTTVKTFWREKVPASKTKRKISKMRRTCSLALPHWEMACQAEPAPSEMKLRCKLQSCPGFEPRT